MSWNWTVSHQCKSKHYNLVSQSLQGLINDLHKLDLSEKFLPFAGIFLLKNFRNNLEMLENYLKDWYYTG